MIKNSHIAIACSYLHVPGGYEKMIITTSNLFAGNGHQVTILILDHTPDTYYPVHSNVNIVHIPMDFGIGKPGNMISRKLQMWKDTYKLGDALKRLKPDYLICTEYPIAVCAILSGAKKMCKVFSWEHHHFNAQVLNRFWKNLRDHTYKKLDGIVCLNKDEQGFYVKLNVNAIVIPNFIEEVPLSIRPRKNFHLITVTRFNHIKGIDLLMDVAKVLLKANPEIKWKVIGYGEKRDLFIDFILREDLSNQLFYQPADKIDITEDYQDAGLFVLTSRNECFPLVLLEAMSNGLPCVAFNCETGPRHIIKSNETGLLVDNQNIEELVSAISSILEDPETLKRMSKNALIAVQQYYPNSIYNLWQSAMQ